MQENEVTILDDKKCLKELCTRKKIILEVIEVVLFRTMEQLDV